MVKKGEETRLKDSMKLFYSMVFFFILFNIVYSLDLMSIWKNSLWVGFAMYVFLLGFLSHLRRGEEKKSLESKKKDGKTT